MSDLKNSERETHLNLTADNRSTWIVFSDDPVMIRRLDRIATATKVTDTGKYYELDKGQVVFRKKIELTEAQRANLRKNARRLKKYRDDRVSGAQN